MYFDEFKHQLPDIDPDETDEWLASLDQVVAEEGENRARFLIYKLLKRARQLQVGLPPLTQTRYINTISPEQEPFFPGDEALEHRIRRMVRWNAVAMVLRANTSYTGIGGHLSTYAAPASLYEVGFNHFFRGKDARPRRPDLLPGPCRAGHVRPGLRRGTPDGGPARSLPARGRAGPGPLVLSARAADARLLGIPDGVDGHRADQRGLPGPLQSLPAQSRPRRHVRLARLGVPRRRRDGRARIDDRPCRSPHARASTT